MNVGMLESLIIWKEGSSCYEKEREREKLCKELLQMAPVHLSQKLLSNNKIFSKFSIPI